MLSGSHMTKSYVEPNYEARFTLNHTLPSGVHIVFVALVAWFQDFFKDFCIASYQKRI